MHNVCENENKNFEALEAHLNGYERSLNKLLVSMTGRVYSRIGP